MTKSGSGHTLNGFLKRKHRIYSVLNEFPHYNNPHRRSLSTHVVHVTLKPLQRETQQTAIVLSVYILKPPGPQLEPAPVKFPYNTELHSNY